MQNINDILADLSISRALLLERVKQGIAKEIEQTYAAIIEDITKQLKSGKPIDNARLKQVVGDVKEQLSIELSLTSKFQDLALQERDWIIASTNEAAGFNIFASIPRESTMLALVSAATVEGAKLSEWLGALDKSQKFDAQRAITLGVSTGETNLQIAKRLADAMDVNMRHAMSLAITGAAQISADARMKVWEANENVIKGYQHHSTLDSRTTLICATRDGAAWDTKGKGLNAKGKQFKFRRPPLHFRCRSILIPVLDMKNAPAGTRSSIDGAIPSTIDFEKWFAGKSPEFQKKYLGEGRLKFYNNGVKLSELIKSNGDVLTLKELREKYS